MKADEIVKALRSCSNSATRRPKCEDCPASRERLCVKVMLEGAADLIESLQAQLADYHHMSELVDGKMKENQRLRRINENLQERLNDVVPVVRGEWICNPDDKKFSLVCSVCGQVMPFIPECLPDNPPFCNCGADMRRESEVKE